MGSNGLQAMKATLVPIQKYSRNAQIIRPITDSIVKKVENALAETNELEDRLEDLLSHQVVHKLTNLKHIVKDVCEQVNTFHSNFTVKIREMLPKIRSGKSKETKLLDVLEWRNRSPFSRKCLTSWLQGKEQDVNIIECLLSTYDYCDQLQLCRVLLDFNIRFVVAMVIKRYGEQDKYSKNLETFNKEDRQPGFWRAWGSGREDPKPEMFVPIKNKVQDIRKMCEDFSDLSKTEGKYKTKYVITEEKLGEDQDGTWEVYLELYEKGAPVRKDNNPLTVNEIQEKIGSSS